MDERIQKELAKKDQTQFHRTLLDHAKGLVMLSRNTMSQYYDDWDRRDKTYESMKTPDRDDRDAVKKGEPAKMVVPLTYAQIQTFIAFGFSVLLNRPKFFELFGVTSQEDVAAKLAEALLEQNLDFNEFSVKLYQYLKHLGVFGLGVFKGDWVRETQKVWQSSQPVQAETSDGKFNASALQQMVDEVKYLGNRITCVSPYRFFPDTRLPLSRYREGEFCASEDIYSITSLHRLEQDGVIEGVKWIEPFRSIDLHSDRSRWWIRRNEGASILGRKNAKTPGSAVMTEVQINIIPSEFYLEDGKPLGEEQFPVKYVVCYVNDTRVVRCEPMNYLHGNFTYYAGQMSPDDNHVINESLASILEHLQAVHDFYINSHVTNVRKNLMNQMVVDPTAVEFEDIRQHKPIIRLKPNASRQPIDKWIMQLQKSDITIGHMQDAGRLYDFMQVASSISDNLQGQPNSGRRSAEEISTVAQGSGMRLAMIFKVQYDSAFKPMGRDFISNLRDGLDAETFVKLTEAPPDLQTYNGFVGITREDLVGRYDFGDYNPLLNGQKQQQAAVLKDMVMEMLQNPQFIPILGYDPRKLVTEIAQLLGIRNPSRFLIDQLRQQEIQQIIQQNAQLQNGIGRPDIESGGITGPTLLAKPAGGNVPGNLVSNRPDFGPHGLAQ